MELKRYTEHVLASSSSSSWSFEYIEEMKDITPKLKTVSSAHFVRKNKMLCSINFSFCQTPLCLDFDFPFEMRIRKWNVLTLMKNILQVCL